MAVAVLTSLSQTTDQILSDVLYPISDDGKRRVALLHEQVVSLQESLRKLPQEAAKSLEARVREAANEAEDVIEHFMYEETQLRYKSIIAGGAVEARAIVNDFGELEMMTKEMKSIAESVKPAPSSPSPMMLQPVPSSSSPTLATAIVDGVTVGMEEDLKKMKELICGESSKLEIIPITGMGGIGKTTLAKKVYDDELIRQKYQVHAWITVSQDHKPKNIFADLQYSLQKVVSQGSEGSSSEAAVDIVYRMLMLRKYLIVLDDVWSKETWNDIKRVFPDVGNGSRIVLTTRLERMASDISSDHLHKMQLMNRGQSWDLLKQKVFPSRKCPSELEKIGKDIATSCGGLPLAVVLVAGILSTIPEARSSWEEIEKDVHSAVDKKEGEFEKIISLSYTHLPLHLRPCFLYMSGFPGNYEIRLSKLIKLWIAERFVIDEEKAQEYMDNLVKRNLASVSTIKSDGKIKSCSVHDLVRDLGKRKALEENYDRRMSITHPDLMRLARAYASSLRSVLSFQPTESSLVGLRKLRLLRVLDVVDTDAYSLPASVFELFHLRYLAFGCPMEIPSAISRLQNLRTLIIRPIKRSRRFSTDEVYLPLEIWTLPLLTHLVSFFDLLPNPEGAASALKELLTLSVVKKLICTEEMMKLISNVKKLAITYFGDRYQEDYQLHNLVLLHQLEKLTLVVKKGSLLQLKANPVFPKTLRKLTLSGWRFPWEDMKAIAALPGLQVLKLRDHAFQGDTWETKERDEETGEKQFPILEYLLIEASDLEKWVTEKDHFPSLKSLALYGCDKLSEIPDDIGEIPTLELIEVFGVNQSLVKCVQRIHEEQKDDYDNKLLQIRVSEGY